VEAVRPPATPLTVLLLRGVRTHLAERRHAARRRENAVRDRPGTWPWTGWWDETL
jgi:hypothetical protein